jgi:hypothetical protein
VNTPDSPTQWLYGLYDFVLVTGFLATIVNVCLRFRQLDASTGASDPNDFTVRKGCARQSQPRVHRIPPHVVTIASAPLVAGDGRSYALDLAGVASVLFLIFVTK